MSYTEQTYAGEWLKWLVQRGVCLESKTIKQDAAATAGLVSGECLEDDTGLVVVATGASCEAILIEPVALADLIAGNTTRLCITRGPAVIDSDKINCASAQKAAALTALAALGIYAVNSALATWSTLADS